MSVPPRVAQMRARTGYNSEEDSDSTHFPPPPRVRTSKKYKSRHRAYSLPREKPASRRSEVNLILCVYRHSTHEWSMEPLRFDPQRINDRELWTQIRAIYREDLQMPWRRVFGFKKLRRIVPIVYTPNMVPVRTDMNGLPDSHTFTHSYHHPSKLRPDHEWVDWFVQLDRNDPDKTNGLEFVEGLWAQKLALLAIISTVGIIVGSVLWSVLGGDLNTIFTVMGFVLTGVAAEIALVALYYQIVAPGT